MKYLFILLICNSIIIINANCQLLELGNKWIYDYRDYSSLNGFYTEKFDSTEVISDTLINGQLYYKLISSEKDPCGIFSHVEYLREDENRIFRLSKNLTDENLLMDFNLQSSYDMNFELFGFDPAIQTTVINDSIGIEKLPSGDQIEIIYQRILNNGTTVDDATFKLSKEVGYLGGTVIFPQIGVGLCDVYQSIGLRCKITKEDTIRLTHFDCYESSMQSSVIHNESDIPILYPNPTSGIVNIGTNYIVTRIQDATGQSMSFDDSNNQVNISHFVGGLYYFTLIRKYDKKRITFKVFKE